MLESAFDEARRSPRNLDEQYQAALAHAWYVLKETGVYDPRTPIPTTPSLSKEDKLILVYKFAQAIRESVAVVPDPDLLTIQLAGEINRRFAQDLEDYIQLEDLVLPLPGLPEYRLPGFEGELQEYVSGIARPLRTAINRGLGAISRDRKGFQTVGQVRSSTVIGISDLYQVGHKKAEFFRELFYKP